MIKKVIFSVITLTIIYFGYNSFNRLRYWERSVQIFKMNSNQTFGRGGFDRGGRASFNPNLNRENGGNERAARPDFGSLPDSVRQRFSQRQLPVQQDSLRQQTRTQIPPSNGNTFRGRGGFEGGDRQRGGFSQRNLRLNTVYRFLAVFAALTVLTIYIDKILKILRKKRKLKAIEINK